HSRGDAVRSPWDPNDARCVRRGRLRGQPAPPGFSGQREGLAAWRSAEGRGVPNQGQEIASRSDSDFSRLSFSFPSIDLAPLFLGRFSGIPKQWGLRLEPLRELEPRAFARFVFFIEQRCVTRGTSPVGETSHHDVMVIGTEANPDRVSDFDRLASLGPI